MENLEVACEWMDKKFGKDEGLRNRQNDHYWRGQMNAQLLAAVGGNGTVWPEERIKEVNKWLSYGASVHAKCKQTGDTAVHFAALLPDVSILRMLLEIGASPRVKNNKGVEPIHVAVKWDNEAAVIALWEKDPDVVNSRAIPNVQTDLHYPDACDSFSEQSILECDFPEDGMSPLHIASMWSNLQIAKLLVDKGAKVQSTESGSTPLDVVLCPKIYYFDHEETFKSNYSFFLGEKLKLPRVSKWFEAGRCKKVQRFTTALHTAVTYGFVIAIEDLLEEGACLGVLDVNGETALHLTIHEGGGLKSLTTILEWHQKHKKSPQLNVRNHSGMTPLHLAAFLGKPEFVKVLLEGGADDTLTALVKNDFFVRHHSQSNILESFVHPEEENGLKKSSSDVKVSLNNDKEKPTYEGPLMLNACCFAMLGMKNRHPYSKHFQCLEILSANGKPLLFEMKYHMNLLHLAAWSNTPEIMKFLLDKFKEFGVLKDKVDQRCDEGTGLFRFAMSPIHFASFHYDDSSKIIELLVKEGKCDMQLAAHSKDYGSILPLHLATRIGIWKDVELIYKLDPSALNRACERREGDHQVLKVPHFAALHSPATLREFLMLGADLSSTAEHGNQQDSLAKFVEMYVDNYVEFLEEVLDAHIDLEHFKTIGSNIGRHETYVELNYRILAPGGENDSQMRVLDALVSSEEVERKQSLLLHPLTESFVYFKWQTKLKTFYNIQVLIQLLMTTIITTLGCLRHVDENQQYETFSEILKYILGILTAVVFFWNPIVGVKRLHSFFGIFNAHGLVWFTMISLSSLMAFTGQGHQWERGVVSLAILLSWMELVYLLARYPWSEKYPLGYHFVMFLVVASNFAQVAASFFLLFIAFALSFLVLLGGDDHSEDEPNPFKTPMTSFLKTITMVNNFEGDQLFGNNSYLGQLESDFAGSALGSAVYLGFFFLMVIAMMNFVQGIAIDDISTLKKEGKARQIYEQAQTLIRLENVMNQPFFRKIGFGSYHVDLKKRVWLKDCIDNNVDVPEYLVLAVLERVKIIQMNDEMKKLDSQKDKKNERDVAPIRCFR